MPSWYVFSNVVNLEAILWCTELANMLELNTEKEGFMAYTARPRAVYAMNPDFRDI